MSALNQSSLGGGDQGPVKDLLRMMNAHRSLLRALRIPGYLEPDGAQSNLFDEMVRFVKYMWERKLQLDATISGQQEEMAQMGVQMEQQ